MQNQKKRKKWHIRLGMRIIWLYLRAKCKRYFWPILACGVAALAVLSLCIALRHRMQ